MEDWETATKLWEYTITSRLTGARQTPPSKNGLNDTKDENGDTNMDEGMEQLEEQEKPLQEFPLLMSEPAWNPAKERQKTIEIAMEDWGVPAFFLAKNGQLAAYVDVWAEDTYHANDFQILTKQGDCSRSRHWSSEHISHRIVGWYGAAKE